MKQEEIVKFFDRDFESFIVFVWHDVVRNHPEYSITKDEAISLGCRIIPQIKSMLLDQIKNEQL